MSARRVTGLLLMLGVIPAACWVAADAWHDAVLNRRARNTEIEKRAAWMKQLDSARARIAAAEAACQELDQKLKGGNPAAQWAGALQAMQDPVRDDPKLQLLRLQLNKASYASRYAAFYSRAKLTPEQIEKLEAALCRRGEATMDIQDVGFALGNPAHTEAQKLMDAAKKASRAELEQLLGPDLARQFAEYERTLPARDFAAELAAASVVSGAPLPRETAERVIELICSASPSYSNGKAVSLEAVDWNTVDQQVAQLLTSAQLQWFKNTLSRSSLRFNALMSRAAVADGLMPAD